ncbi:hypothetical protein FMEXI_3465 [Fusarium mexicanum]|uniref:Heterokaryon incompatibility domain-containing protein n=1 Tax=Fusarium mexicanum TaxID=751941 RepID=A0A8H5N3N9_9HYPO|nr:hypothetical protein FMEXI_3465 [Fusarium mexicanum]
MASPPSRLCTLCGAMFKGKLPDIDQWLPHHNRVDLLAASDLGCFICTSIVKSRSWDNVPRQSLEKFEYSIFYKRKESGLDFSLLYIRPSPGADGWAFKNEISEERGRPASISTLPTDPFDSELPQKWMQECIGSHEICQRGDLSYRPTRLLEIIDSKRLRLVETCTRSTGPYVSLSHCWGNQKMMTLKANNLAQLCDVIQVADLPKKYQEAISWSSLLGIHFIWIDSLCIIQDDKDDWEHEAVNMKKVYGSSLLNICSAAASDSNGVSFRGRDPSIMECLSLTSSWDGETDIDLKLEYDVLWEDITDSPLRKRAWVFQEWYLSPRSLILSHNQLWWQCRQNIACERYPEYYPKARHFQGMKSNKIIPESKSQSFGIWDTHVREYVRTTLTHETDRLIAFAGVAQDFYQTQMISDQYLAGLWQSNLPQALCWGIDNNFTRSRRTSHYTAPSWSWASMSGPIGLAGLTPSAKDRVVSVESVWLKHAVEGHSTGVVQGGYIKLRGHLIGPLTLEHQDLPKTNSKGHIEIDDPTTYLPKLTDGGNFDTWGGVLYPDEMTQDTSDKLVSLLSYLDNLTPGLCEQGIVDKSSRKIERLDEAKGRYFCLPIVRDECWFKNGRFLYGDTFKTLYCLALFQPTHQHTVFHRIGTIRFEKEIPNDQFKGIYTKQTITIV